MPKYNHPPSFPLYPQHLVADGKVEAMTTEEVGAYMLLLCKAWYEEPVATIPDDDWTLARWTRLTVGRWRKCKPRVLSAFRKCDNGRYEQPRLRDEYERQRAYSRRQSSSGKQGADRRWGKKGKGRGDGGAIAPSKPKHGKAIVPPMANDSSSSSSSSSTTTNQPVRAPPQDNGGLVGGDLIEENGRDPRLAALTRAGVAEGNQADLAALPGVTAEVIDRVNRETRKGGGHAGAVVITLRQESKRIETEQQARVKRGAKIVSDRLEARARLVESAKALKDEIDRLTAIPKAERDRLVAYVIEHTEFWRHRPPENRDPFANRVLRASVLTEHAKEQKPATNLGPNGGKPEEPF